MIRKFRFDGKVNGKRINSFYRSDLEKGLGQMKRIIERRAEGSAIGFITVCESMRNDCRGRPLFYTPFLQLELRIENGRTESTREVWRKDRGPAGMDLQPPEKLINTSPRVEEDNLLLRAFLKGRDPDEVDKLIHEMHRELFSGIDCIACSNCCRVIAPVLNNDDIARMAQALDITEDQFKARYLTFTDDEWLVKGKPCLFLTGQGCSIYYFRPETCRQYPYTDKTEVVSRLANLVDNCAVCPVVFEIFERLKKIYKSELADIRTKWFRIGKGFLGIKPGAG